MNLAELYRQLDCVEHALADLAPDEREPIDLFVRALLGVVHMQQETIERLRGQDAPSRRALFQSLYRESAS